MGSIDCRAATALTRKFGVVLLEQLGNLTGPRQPGRSDTSYRTERSSELPSTPPPHRKQRRLTPLQVGQLADGYRAGESVGTLAAAFGVHRTTVLGHLEKHGVAQRPNTRKLTDEAVAVLAESYLAGKSMEGLGERFGVSTETIRKELRGAGIERRAPGRPRSR